MMRASPRPLLRGVSLCVTTAWLFAGWSAAAAAQETASQKRQIAEWQKLAGRFRTLYGQERFEEAEVVAREALDLSERALGPQHVHVATSLENLSLSLQKQERPVEAEPLLLRALAIREASLGPQHADIAKSLSNLGRFYEFRDDRPKALAYYQRALAMLEALKTPDDVSIASALHDVAAVYRAEGRHAEAKPLIQRELSIWENALGIEHPLLIFVLDSYADTLRQLGEERRAASIEARTERLRRIRDAKGAKRSAPAPE
jgi:tetratricopeptide (TPR) repeat protein